MFQKEKQLVRSFNQALDAAQGSEIETIMSRFVSANATWRGFHPFNELVAPAQVAQTFWRPLRRSLSHMQRRMDIFMAGQNEIDGFQSVWVVSMGHLMGLFDEAWLGIAPTGKMAFLRYCDFSRIEDDKIVETAMYFDIPHFMIQAGHNPFPEATAVHLVQPGPITHGGLLLDRQDPAEGKATLAAINKMIADLGQWDSALSLEDELRRSWHEDMIWWGPAGIGATYTIERYAKQHAGPFRAAFSDRSKTRHVCRLAEGHFGGFFGWPNFSARLSDTFMGLPATGEIGEFRVIDIYRRDGDRLAENWIFIDLLHFWKGLGVDVLEDLQGAPHT